MNQNWIPKTACVLCITAKISDDRVTALRPSRTAGVNRRRRRASVLSCASGGGGVKRGEFRATARAVGPTRHWCVSVTPPPRGSHLGRDAAPVPPPWNRCGRVAAPRNEIAARASTSRQALRTSSCFPVTPRIAVAPVVVVNRHSSSLPVNAPLRRRRHRRENDIRDHIRLSANEIRSRRRRRQYFIAIIIWFRRLNFSRSPILCVFEFFFFFLRDFSTKSCYDRLYTSFELFSVRFRP